MTTKNNIDEICISYKSNFNKIKIYILALILSIISLFLNIIILYLISGYFMGESFIRITGKIIDSSGDPILLAIVSLVPSPETRDSIPFNECRTDYNGIFRKSIVYNGSSDGYAIIQVSKIGYKRKYVNIKKD